MSQDCCNEDVLAAWIVTCQSTKVSESFGLVCELCSVWTSSRGWRSSLPVVAALVLPLDQAHVDERENHSNARECNFDSCSSCVAGAFRLGEEISGADTRRRLVLVWRSRMVGQEATYATA